MRVHMSFTISIFVPWQVGIFAYQRTVVYPARQVALISQTEMAGCVSPLTERVVGGKANRARIDSNVPYYMPVICSDAAAEITDDLHRDHLTTVANLEFWPDPPDDPVLAATNHTAGIDTHPSEIIHMNFFLLVCFLLFHH